MGMSGKEMNLVVAVETVEERSPVGLSVKVGGSGVHCDNYRCGLGHIGKVLCQPGKFLISNKFIVLPIILSTAFAGTEDIVKNDIMYIADVE